MNKPTVCIGVRLATLAIAPDARILAVGLAAWDIGTLRFINSYFGVVDVHDPETKDMFYTDPSTLDWWEGSHPSSPSTEAKRACFSGGITLREVLKQATDFIEGLAQYERVIVGKPPAFDLPILTNAYGHLNLYRGLLAKPSMVDSGHTAERGLETLGFGEVDAREEAQYCLGQPFVQHHPRCESAKLTYFTARYYHLLNIIRKKGYDEALAAHKQMLTGEYAGYIGIGD